MTPEEVRAIIDNEIAGDWDRENPHGVDLRRCLVTPVLRCFIAPPALTRHWLVLEEDPDGECGYKIVFDENSRMFGLACRGVTGEDAFLGLHGSFLNTLDAM